MVSTTLELKTEEYKKVSIFHRFLHNRRLHHKCKNSIFDTKYNYVKNFQNFENEDEITNEEEVLKKYVKKKTKRSSQIENHILESTINISNDQEIEKFNDEEKQRFLIEKTEKYIETLKSKYGIKFYQYRIHLDEGHYETDINNKEILDEKGNKIEIRNIHIHLIHSNVTSEGKSFIREVGNESWKTSGRRGIHIIQDLVSENFELKRGEVNSENKHLNKQQYVSMIKQSKEKRKVEIEKIELEFKEKENELNKNFELKKEEIEKMTFTQFLKVKDEKYKEEITKTKIKFQEEETKLKNNFEIEKDKKIEEFKELTKENWVNIVSTQNEELTKKNRRLEIENDIYKIDNKDLKESNKDLREEVNHLNFLLRGFFGFFGNLYNEKFKETHTKEEIIHFIQVKSEIQSKINEKNTEEIEKKKTIIDTLKDKYKYVKNLFEYKDEEDIKIEEKQKYYKDLNKDLNIPQKIEDNKEEDKKVIVEYKGEKGYFTEEVETNNFGLPIGTKKKFVKIGK